MNDEEKINQANICKEKGTKRFKEQQFKIACGHYARVIELLTNQETNVSVHFDGKPIILYFDAQKVSLLIVIWFYRKIYIREEHFFEIELNN